MSAKGLKLSRDIMRLNYTLGELNHNDFEQYGEWLYHVTVMGEPSATRALGLPGRRPSPDRQLLRARRSGRDVAGVLGLGARHRAAPGSTQGTSILQVERNEGLALLRALSAEQRAKAILTVSKTGNDNVGEAFKDNVVLAYAGVRATELGAAQKQQLLALIAEYVGNLRDDQARVQMERRPAPTSTTPTSRGSAAASRTASSTTASTAR